MLAFGVTALAGAPFAQTGWKLLAYGVGTGKQAIAQAAVPGIVGEHGPNHHALLVRVLTKPPNLTVEVTWEVDCDKKHLGATVDTRSFTKTLINVPGCAANLTAELPSTGTVRVVIYGR